jgi:hypothetical protein
MTYQGFGNDHLFTPKIIISWLLRGIRKYGNWEI